MIRKIISIGLGALLLFGAFYGAKSMIASKKQRKKEFPPTVKSVYTRSVQNGEVPIMVTANGDLVSSRKIELYSEVQGVLLENVLPFKAGQSFKKGSTLLKIDSREYYATLLSERSRFYDLIVAMMPDLKFDYPEAFVRWENYLKAFDINQNLRPLPEIMDEKENYFITGKQIITTYYTIKNQEERLKKYIITAPFSGVLTESLVNSGTLIRSGQKLGEFVSLQSFELEVAINAQYMDILKVGEQVKLNDLNGENSWTGIVKRVNGRLDQETQTVTVYIEVSGKGLVEGMYLEAVIAAEAETDAIEIPRDLMLNEKEVYVVVQDTLMVKEITAVYFTETTAVIKGLPDGTQLVAKPVAGAYARMPVKIISEKALDKK